AAAAGAAAVASQGSG
ncbi:hypothetical protein, partial [Mycobacterium senriense]